MEAGQERGALLREAILRDSTTLEDAQAAIARVQATMEPTTTPDYITVPGYKNVESVSESQSELLEAVQDVVARLKEYWPLSIRQIHYQLLNDPRSRWPPRCQYNQCDPSHAPLAVHTPFPNATAPRLWVVRWRILGPSKICLRER